MLLSLRISSVFVLFIGTVTPAASFASPEANIVHLPDVSELDPSAFARFDLHLKELDPRQTHHLLTHRHLNRRRYQRLWDSEHEAKEGETDEYQVQEMMKRDFEEEHFGSGGGRNSAQPLLDKRRDSTSIPLTMIPKEIGYTAAVSIGSYPDSVFKSSSSQEESDSSTVFHLLVDTGSDLVVVTSTACQDPECLQLSRRFDCSASLTCQPIPSHPSDMDSEARWQQKYGDGTIANGTLVEDTVRLLANSGASLVSVVQLDKQPFLLVDQPGLNLVKSYGQGTADGILGLNIQSPLISKTVVQNLQSLGQTTRMSHANSGDPRGVQFMSLWLGKSSLLGQQGELLLDAVDRTKFRGSLRWSERGPSPHDWSLLLDRGILLHHHDPPQDLPSPEAGPTPPPLFSRQKQQRVPVRKPFDTTASIQNTDWVEQVAGTSEQYAVLDSGSDGIYLRRPEYHQLFRQIPGAIQLENGYWRVPCQGSIDLLIGIQSVVYRIPYQDWVKKPNKSSFTSAPLAGKGHAETEVLMCQSMIYGSSPGPILLGTTFMRSVYTVFDFSRPGDERIGLAKLMQE